VSSHEKDFATGDNSRALTFSFARQMKYWEIIADRLSAAGWSWGCVSTVDSKARTIWIADAHRDEGKRFVARATFIGWVNKNFFNSIAKLRLAREGLSRLKS
jgi:hypothetical protein